jgi:hypothetical protein
MVQNSRYEADSRSAGQEIHRFFMQPKKTYYHFHTASPLDSVLSYYDPLHILALLP